MAKELPDEFITCLNGAPALSGVYAICVRSEVRRFKGDKHKPERVLYIGSSSSVSKRVYSTGHPYEYLCDRFKDYVVYVKFLTTNDYANAEMRLIKQINPIMNQQHRTNRKQGGINNGRMDSIK